MLVVMKPLATPAQLEEVQSLLASHALSGHLSQGEVRTVIGVFGQRFPTDFEAALQSLPGVEQTVLISKPYKLVSREFQPHNTVVQVGDVAVGGDEVVVIAGPCSVENQDQILRTAYAVRESGARLLRGGAFKPRTSPYAFRGLGQRALELLALAREQTGLGIVTEVMTPQDVDLVGQYTDVFQIGARNMQNYALLEAVGNTQTPVLLKRGLSATIEEWLLAAEYVAMRGNRSIIMCERGIRTFETALRNTLDLNAVAYIREVAHLPVLVDPSHATGKRSLVPALSRAAIAGGADGLIVEVHPDPEHAQSDGAQSLNFPEFRQMMRQLQSIAQASGRVLGAAEAGLYHESQLARL
ncbi:MAG TPA: 3-deoxy-7-phosphoheptulonate synthase [Roseiflexaceae bacterium]|nr:3-deoxy-7-phosphoheptulonate synthase [Roseiflexaceae bacterium]